MKLKTPNTFVECSCGRNVKLEQIDEVKICNCGKKVQFSEPVKQYFIKRDVEHKKASEININGLVIKPVEYIRIKK